MNKRLIMYYLLFTFLSSLVVFSSSTLLNDFLSLNALLLSDSNSTEENQNWIKCKNESDLYQKTILLQLINYSGFSHGDYGNEDDYVNVTKINNTTSDIDKRVMKYLSNTHYYIGVCYFESCMNYINDLSTIISSRNETEINKINETHRDLYKNFTQSFGIENDTIYFYIPNNDKDNEKPFLFSIFILVIYLTVVIGLDIYQRAIQFKTMVNIKKDIPITEEKEESEEEEKKQSEETYKSSLTLFRTLIKEGVIINCI